MGQVIQITDDAYNTVAPLKREGYSIKLLASNAILKAYSYDKNTPQDTVSDIADALLKKHGSKDKAAAAIYSGFPAEFKEQIKSRIMEGGRK